MSKFTVTPWTLLLIIPVAWIVVSSAAGALPTCPTVCKCRCNNVTLLCSVECTYQNLQTVPTEIPRTTTSLNLAANDLTVITDDSLARYSMVHSIWLSYNNIQTISDMAFMRLGALRNLDLGNNELKDFPWESLQYLPGLQLFKLNNNKLTYIPIEAFNRMTKLRSLRIHHNEITALPSGAFDRMNSLSHLLLHANPWHCNCGVQWLADWLKTTNVDVQQRKDITCATPAELHGERVDQAEELPCKAPTARAWAIPKGVIPVESRVYLHCAIDGDPLPTVKWITPSGTVRPKDEGTDRMIVLRSVQYRDRGTYICVATNPAGSVSSKLILTLTRDPVPVVVKTTVTPKVATTPDKPAPTAAGTPPKGPTEKGGVSPGGKPMAPTLSSATTVPTQGGGVIPTRPSGRIVPQPTVPKPQTTTKVPDICSEFTSQGSNSQMTADLELSMVKVSTDEATVRFGCTLDCARPPFCANVTILDENSNRTISKLLAVEVGGGSDHHLQHLRPGTLYRLCVSSKVCTTFSTLPGKTYMEEMLGPIIVGTFLCGMAIITLSVASIHYAIIQCRKPKVVIKTETDEEEEENGGSLCGFLSICRRRLGEAQPDVSGSRPNVNVRPRSDCVTLVDNVYENRNSYVDDPTLGGHRNAALWSSMMSSPDDSDPKATMRKHLQREDTNRMSEHIYEDIEPELLGATAAPIVRNDEDLSDEDRNNAERSLGMRSSKSRRIPRAKTMASFTQYQYCRLKHSKSTSF
ncbi:uncharacterized protein LOC144882055 [Branchiostoma floridae x Branchiostoma japonicum]